jgi:hypothetical protein
VLSHAEDTKVEWIGNDYLVKQLLAAWMVVDERDMPLNPRILGAPGIGKTTLACAAAQRMGQPVYIFQATADTRPEDLIIQPVIASSNEITYHASPLVTAMITGGICVLDEGNRMSEKSWASLAPLLDHRRYVESIIAGIKIRAHPDFRICCTMNNDASTYEIPEYIQSRIQPQITIEFPNREDELKILQFNVPFSDEELLNYVVDFLQRAHKKSEPYSVRDGISITRFSLKLMASEVKDLADLSHVVERAVRQVLGERAIRYLSDATVNDEPAKDSIPHPPDRILELLKPFQIRQMHDHDDEDDDDEDDEEDGDEDDDDEDKDVKKRLKDHLDRPSDVDENDGRWDW